MGDDEISQGETSQETAQSSIFDLLGDYWANCFILYIISPPLYRGHMQLDKRHYINAKL
jgi:hypothetical protein